MDLRSFSSICIFLAVSKAAKGRTLFFTRICFYCDDEFEAENDLLPTESQNSRTKIKIYFWIKDKNFTEFFKWQDEWYQTGDYPNVGKIDTYPDMEMKILGLELNFQRLKDEQGIVKEANRVKEELKKHLNYAPAI